jgi:hypothetical protein
VSYKYNGPIIRAEEESTEEYFFPSSNRDSRTEQPHLELGESDQEIDRDAEDWERHEALHPPEHEELKYEEEIDKKWEKGSSGLGNALRVKGVIFNSFLYGFVG